MEDNINSSYIFSQILNLDELEIIAAAGPDTTISIHITGGSGGISGGSIGVSIHPNF